MTIKEYVNQLPGMAGKYAFEMGCPNDYGFDHQNCTGHCGDCLYAEDTINGKPAPHLFACPVRPGQIVYSLHVDPMSTLTTDPLIVAQEVLQVVFMGDNEWRADVGGVGSIDESRWMKSVFPTMKTAEDAVKRMKENR